MDPLALDWGKATAEFANEEKNSAVHVFNHDLTTAEKAERAVRFALARVKWFKGRMPAGGTQEVWFDDREQAVSPEVRQMVKARVAPHVAGFMFFSEGEA